MKKKRKIGKGKLSFAVDDEEDGGDEPVVNRKAKDSKQQVQPESKPGDETSSNAEQDNKAASESGMIKRRLGPNTNISNAPRILTKSAVRKEEQAREELRKEFVAMQEAVKATEIMIPFVFYDGTNVPGGSCRVKKGDPIWAFLDKTRKLGAEMVVGGSGEAKNRREWARVGVDDLMLVRGEIIIPHHYDFYGFIVNKTIGYDGQPIFRYSANPPKDLRKDEALPERAGLFDPRTMSDPSEGKLNEVPSSSLEGAGDDPSLTKVVNRQWYERNKHIFPASLWEDFDPKKDYTTSTRRDAQGNTFFFPR